MLVHTSRRLSQGQVVLPDDINRSVAQISETFNGGLGQHNMPVAVLTTNKFEVMALDNTTWSSIGVVSSYGPCNSFHMSDSTVAGDNTDLASIPLTDGGFKPGWNKLSAIMNEGARLRFTSQEGMLKGNALIAWERRMGHYDSGGGIYVPEGEDLWVEFSVWVNDVMVMQSGPLYPRRSTLDLPFVTPIGSGDCVIEVCWKAITEILDSSNTEPDQNLNFYSAQTSCRNQYR